MRRLASLVLLASALGLPSIAQDLDVRPVSFTEGATRTSAFSGLPVPRFESLKYAAVHGRAGPSFDYPIVWKYERSGLPVMIIKESRDWRMVRDPSGDEVWMHKRMLGGRLSVMIQGEEEVALRASDKTSARTTALLEPGLIADLMACDGTWCRIAAAGRKGWVERSHLFGAPGTR